MNDFAAESSPSPSDVTARRARRVTANRVSYKTFSAAARANGIRTAGRVYFDARRNFESTGSVTLSGVRFTRA